MPDVLRHYRRWLPHWRVPEAVYFVTWRCGSSKLSVAERSLVAEALRYFDGSRYVLYCFVVMDDHVHAIVRPLDRPLEKILHTWKSFTAHGINKLRNLTGPVWQREYFDRVVRDEDEFYEKCGYILNNPFKRWPELREYEWAVFLAENMER